MLADTRSSANVITLQRLKIAGNEKEGENEDEGTEENSGRYGGHGKRSQFKSKVERCVGNGCTAGGRYAVITAISQ